MCGKKKCEFLKKITEVSLVVGWDSPWACFKAHTSLPPVTVNMCRQTAILYVFVLSKADFYYNDSDCHRYGMAHKV